MKKTRCGTGLNVEQALADGEITQGDADEIEQFADFLRRSVGMNSAAKARLYLEMYPNEKK